MTEVCEECGREYEHEPGPPDLSGIWTLNKTPHVGEFNESLAEKFLQVTQRSIHEMFQGIVDRCPPLAYPRMESKGVPPDLSGMTLHVCCVFCDAHVEQAEVSGHRTHLFRCEGCGWQMNWPVRTKPDSPIKRRA